MAAGINKSTFYSHYRDKYDLLDNTVSEATMIFLPGLDRVFSVILNKESTQSDFLASAELFANIYQRNERLMRIVMKSASGNALASKISDLIEKIWVEKNIADPELVYYSYLINAITYILIGTTEKWVKRDCVDPPEDIMRLAQDVGIGVQNALMRIQL